MIKPLTAALILTALLITLNSAYTQSQDPCITTERKINLQEGTPPIDGTLTGRLEEHYFRLDGIKPGQRLTVEVEVRANTSVGMTILLLRETQPRTFARIAGSQLVVSREPINQTFSWIEASPGWGLPALCLKVGQFSEARPVTSNYKISISVEDVSDYGGGDAPDKPEKAVDIGQITYDKPITISGYLSSTDGGNDHTDFYILSAQLSRGDELVVETKVNPDTANVEIAILDMDIFGLRSNRTAAGLATLRLPWEKTGTQPFYLKFSNTGGVGGEAQYTARISIRKAQQATETTQTQPTNQELQPLEPTTARMIVFGGVTLVAALSVFSLVMRLREPRIREITYDEWQA
ncbi:hypothetical protein HRbin01_01746 [archaeon HR01]|nr:hypothetical protein HRbin01_01746 [archaeon HR01]